MSDVGRTYRILSLDGGGIRGLMTAIWLKRLEERIGPPLHRHFDLIAGTSTGAILACGISAGIEIDHIIKLYVERGREIFPPPMLRFWSRVARLFSDGISAPKYDGEGLNRVLKDFLGATAFGSLAIQPTLVLSYDVAARRTVVFKSTKDEHRNLPIWEICRASASAPAYFPAHVMRMEGADKPLALVDGGILDNNPTACAIAEGVRLNSPLPGDAPPSQNVEPCALENFIVASFGTGKMTRPIKPEQAQEWGAAQWALHLRVGRKWTLPIIDVLFDGSAAAVEYIARHLIEPKNYFRFQTKLDEASKASDDLDNADPDNIDALRRLAQEYIDGGEGKNKMDQLAERLTDHS